MKLTIATVAFIAAAIGCTSANAQLRQSDICSLKMQMATTAMMDRQMGRSQQYAANMQADIIGRSMSGGSGRDHAIAVMVANAAAKEATYIVRFAYSTPYYEDPDMKEMAVAVFANYVFDECMSN